MAAFSYQFLPHSNIPSKYFHDSNYIINTCSFSQPIHPIPLIDLTINNENSSFLLLTNNELSSVTRKQRTESSSESSSVVDIFETCEQVITQSNAAPPIIIPNERKKRSSSQSKNNAIESRGRKIKKSNDHNGNKDEEKIKGRSIRNIKKKISDDEKKVAEEATIPTGIGYIHVRARRGQATDSHSLAERVRREKISEKMKTLQGLVPGCDKVTGKALVLDEIINYVQSLQTQVELLSMKLASVNSSYEFEKDLESFMVVPESTAFVNITAATTTSTKPSTSTTENTHHPLLTHLPNSLSLHQSQTLNTFPHQDNMNMNNMFWDVEDQSQNFLISPPAFTSNAFGCFNV